MKDDPRLADIIYPGTDGNVVLLGFPYDEGVARNGGRTGARSGPEKMRAWLRRFGTVFNPELGIDLSPLRITDAGDIDPGLPLEQAHAALTAKVKGILQAGGTPFVAGGGNDQSWPNAQALLDTHESCRVGAINVDAHLDVRPLIEGKAHSGSPFRLLLEDARFSGELFVEFATQGSQAAKEHVEYVRHRDGHIHWLSEIYMNEDALGWFSSALGRVAWDCDAVFVSFDLDSVRMADAPGVSAPSVMGLRGSEALEIARIAGQNPKVQLFDLSEYNPEIEEERTGRLAASMFYYFCLGVASRKEA
ncbi:putative Arginase [Nitrospina gracilis 3/211]|uniref:Putative Arginase n=1 Tax=Nitrospina gracilis (strain 3/211) TaxID=1266370 RepID=M1YYN9_NITG3|nr:MULTISPECIES: formimidoylglutamase [Nitrospina]MCF8723723.1 formiminoglutamase [Nitrospina sp. Nb-3]CCQ90821.1 putative Arginase [Nitrospina gracilis 3/211]